MSPEEETVINRNTMKLQNHLYKALKQRDQYKTERDTLIDDLSWYKVKISRLEREKEKLTSQGLREQCKEYAQDASKFLNLLSEISQHIGNKPSSSTYKYFRAKLDWLGIKEGE